MIKDDTGFASRQLQEPTGLNQSALNSLLHAMEDSEQILRTIRGKRTYEILLNTDNPDVQWVLNQDPPVAQPTLAESVRLPTPTDPFMHEPEPALESESEPVEYEPNLADLADALLRRVVMVLNRPPVEDQSQLVADLRKELSNIRLNLETALQAVKDQDLEIDKLRRENKELKSRVGRRDPHLTQTLRSMLSPQDWDKLMREVPKEKGD